MNLLLLLVFVALCERQSAGNDQRTWHKWRLSWLNARNPKMIKCIRFPIGRAQLSRLRVFVGPPLLSAATQKSNGASVTVPDGDWSGHLHPWQIFIRKFIYSKRKGFALGILFWGYERFTGSFIGSFGLALLAVEGTPPSLPGFSGMSVRTVNERFMPLFAHDCL